MLYLNSPVSLGSVSRITAACRPAGTTTGALIVIWTLAVVPSTDAMGMVSITDSPDPKAAIVGFIVSSVYSHVPEGRIENVPYVVAVFVCSTIMSSPGSGSMTVTISINTLVSSLSMKPVKLKKAAGVFAAPAPASKTATSASTELG